MENKDKKGTIYLLLLEIEKSDFGSMSIDFILKEKNKNESELQVKKYFLSFLSRMKQYSLEHKTNENVNMTSVLKIENESNDDVKNKVLDIILKSGFATFSNENFTTNIKHFLEIEKQITDAFKNTKEVEFNE